MPHSIISLSNIRNYNLWVTVWNSKDALHLWVAKVRRSVVNLSGQNTYCPSCIIWLVHKYFLILNHDRFHYVADDRRVCSWKVWFWTYFWEQVLLSSELKIIFAIRSLKRRVKAEASSGAQRDWGIFGFSITLKIVLCILYGIALTVGEEWLTGPLRVEFEANYKGL